MIKVYTVSDTTPASATTTAGDAFHGLADYEAITIVANLLGATGGTLDVYLQTSHDGGTTWYDWIAFPQLGDGASAVAYRVACPPMAESGITTIGSGTSPALSADTVVGGFWGDSIRAIYKAGAGTSAGAAITINIVAYKKLR